MKKEIELMSDLERFKMLHEIHPTAETLQQLENGKADLELLLAIPLSSKTSTW